MASLIRPGIIVEFKADGSKALCLGTNEDDLFDHNVLIKLIEDPGASEPLSVKKSEIRCCDEFVDFVFDEEWWIPDAIFNCNSYAHEMARKINVKTLSRGDSPMCLWISLSDIRHVRKLKGFATNQHVVLDGLKNSTALNGCVGRILSSRKGGRYAVKVDAGDEDPVSVKCENIRPLCSRMCCHLRCFAIMHAFIVEFVQCADGKEYCRIFQAYKGRYSGKEWLSKMHWMDENETAAFFSEMQKLQEKVAEFIKDDLIEELIIPEGESEVE